MLLSLLYDITTTTTITTITADYIIGFLVDMIADVNRIHIDIVVIVVITNFDITVVVVIPGGVDIVILVHSLSQWTVVSVAFITTGYFFHKCMRVSLCVCNVRNQ